MKKVAIVEYLGQFFKVVRHKRNHRQTELEIKAAHHAHGGLDRDRVGFKEHGPVDGHELEVQASGFVHIPGEGGLAEVGHQFGSDVRGHGDDAAAAHGDVGSTVKSSAGEDLETFGALFHEVGYMDEIRGGFLDEALFGDIGGEHLVTVLCMMTEPPGVPDENVPHAVEGDGIDDKAREVLHVDRADEHAGYFAPVIDRGGDDERLFLRIRKDKRPVEGLCALQCLLEIGGGFPAGGVLARIDAGDHGPPAIEDGQTVDAWEVEHGPPQMTGKELAPFASGDSSGLRSSSMMAMRFRHCVANAGG